MADSKLVEEIKKKTTEAKVMIFMKGTPQFPQCGFSNRACKVLEAAGAKNFAFFDVLSDDLMWDALEAYTNWPTVPQIFVNGKFIGGCDIISEMHERGELTPLLST